MTSILRFGNINGLKKIHEHWKVFHWKVAVEALPTRVRLDRCFPLREKSCAICNSEDESADDHLFFECDLAKAMWFGSHFAFRSFFWRNLDILGKVNLIAHPS